MKYTQDLILDLNANTAYTTIGAKQGDSNSRIIRVFITENGESYTIPVNSTAYFRLRKPDGKAVLNEAVIDYTTNSISAVLTSQQYQVVDMPILHCMGHSRKYFLPYLLF